MSVQEESSVKLARGRRVGQLTRTRQRQLMAVLMVLPAVLIVVGVVFYPVAQALWLSLHSIDLRYPWKGEPFVGLDNYINAFQEPRLFDALIFTTSFVIVSVGLEFLFGLGVAVLLQRDFKGRGLVRALVLIPWSLTTVVVGRMWNLIYNSEYGVLNSLLKSLGLIKDNLLWTADRNLTFWAVIGADVWKATPFVAIILLAGLQTIPTDLYEAAKVDGSNPLQSFWHITLPLLRPAVLVAVLFRTIDAARVFDMVFVLTEGGFGTESLNLYTYRILFGNLNFGYGSALAVITFGYILIFAILYLYVLGRREQDRTLR